MENNTNEMQQVWISCPRCSVSFKIFVLADGDYSETKLCNYCISLCEYCEEKKSSTDNNICESCQSNLITKYFNNIELSELDQIQELQNDTNSSTYNEIISETYYNKSQIEQDSNILIDSDDDSEAKININPNYK